VIFRNYILIFILSLSSTVVAQTLKITSPEDGEYWNLENKNKIVWVANGLSGTLEIQYSETGNSNSWKKYKVVTFAEAYVTFYVQELIDGLDDGHLYIRIKAIDTSHSYQVRVNVKRAQHLSVHWFLITKNDNIRKGAHQTYERIKYCKFDERYKILGKEGSWYKIKLDQYPYYGYTHDTNGVVVTQEQLDRGISADDYVKRPPPTPHVQSELLGNYLNLVSGSGYIGYSSKFTYGYVLSGPLLKLGPLLIGTGSKSADYHSTYRVGLVFIEDNYSDEIDSWQLIFENFLDNKNNQHHIIDLGIMAIMNDPDMYLKLGYRHQFDNGKVFDEIINSSLSGVYIEAGYHIGGMW